MLVRLFGRLASFVSGSRPTATQVDPGESAPREQPTPAELDAARGVIRCQSLAEAIELARRWDHPIVVKIHKKTGGWRPPRVVFPFRPAATVDEDDAIRCASLNEAVGMARQRGHPVKVRVHMPGGGWGSPRIVFPSGEHLPLRKALKEGRWGVAREPAFSR